MKRGTTLSAVIGLMAAAALVVAGCSSSGDTADTTTSTGSSTTESSAPTETTQSSSEAPSTESSEPTSENTSEEPPADELSGTLTVFAAASLKATFDQLRAAFMEQHPNVDFPEINYDGSSTLVEQIQGGAPADVFASADEKNMDKVADLVTGRVDFATNSLQIAVAPGNPKGITGLADLGKEGIITVLCAPDVPCGSASHKALDAAGVTVTPASEEQNVKAVLTKVESGDADAGLVYTTDVNSAGGDVDGIDFPEAAQAINTYPIAVVSESANEAAAQAFIDLVTSDAGQQVLAAVGFGKP